MAQPVQNLGKTLHDERSISHRQTATSRKYQTHPPSIAALLDAWDMPAGVASTRIADRSFLDLVKFGTATNRGALAQVGLQTF